MTQACKDMGVTCHYHGTTTFDLNAMGQLIDAAIGLHPAGIVVTIPDATAIGPHIKAAVAAGIPVVCANSGYDVAISLGCITHIGQDEGLGGQVAGERFKAEGVKHALCINGDVGNVALDQRCKGFATGLGGTSAQLQVDQTNPTATLQKIAAALQADPTIDGLFSTGQVGTDESIQAIAQQNLAGKVHLAGMDLDTLSMNGVKDGTVEFLIDQQPWLQGYLPVVFLTYYHLYGVMAGQGQVILSGPALITKDNVGLAQQFAGTIR